MSDDDLIWKAAELAGLASTLQHKLDEAQDHAERMEQFLDSTDLQKCPDAHAAVSDAADAARAVIKGLMRACTAAERDAKKAKQAARNAL